MYSVEVHQANQIMENQQELKLEDIPVMNYGKYMIDKMRAFGDKEALVIFCKFGTRARECHYYSNLGYKFLSYRSVLTQAQDKSQVTSLFNTAHLHVGAFLR